MCVIIYVPKESKIEMSEIEDAWYTNPDGAGYIIQKDGRVYCKRGFMNLQSFSDEIEPLIGNYNLLLHFRISTSNAVNRIQTHPYKKGNVTLTEGTTKRPIICMNGIISGQKEYLDCNDTMSYIIDHENAFSVINQDILNIIESDTGAKWAVMKPDEVILSSKFIEQDGKYYSNQNHLWTRYVKSYNTKRKKRTFNKMIKDFWLKNQIRRDKELYSDVLDFIDEWCNADVSLCGVCTKCLKSAKRKKDVVRILDENFYYPGVYGFNDYSYENEDNSCNDSCNDTIFYNDLYDYESGWYNNFDE